MHTCLRWEGAAVFGRYLSDVDEGGETHFTKLNVTVLEAVELDDIDPEAVKQGLAQYTAAYAAATEDYAKTEAEIEALSAGACNPDVVRAEIDEYKDVMPSHP
mgnify:CR=1 FL=1